MSEQKKSARQDGYDKETQRLDIKRKTSRNVMCKPPNVKCGGRCIPPNWDCRLKNQGADKQLAAVKSDPISAVANVQRGIGRLKRGVLTGNFAEIEGGKRALIRGVVKGTPGNIQQKKALKAKLENRSRAIGMGLAVLGGGFGVHQLLKRTNPRYRNTVAPNIENSMRTGMNNVLDRIPYIGGQRRANRALTGESTRLAATVAMTNKRSGPSAAAATLGQGGENVISSMPVPGIGGTNSKGARTLENALNTVDKGTHNNLFEWQQKHRAAFMGARTTEGSVFAESSTNAYLTSTYGLPKEVQNKGAGEVRDALRTQLEAERGNYLQLARDGGFRVRKDNKGLVEDDMDSFVLYATKGLNKTVPEDGVRGAQDHIRQLVRTRSMQGYARQIYKETVDGFDNLFKTAAERVTVTPGAAVTSTQRREGLGEVIQAVDSARARYMGAQINLNKNPEVKTGTPSINRVVDKVYFATKVMGGNDSTTTLTRAEAVNAASEIAGRQISQTAESVNILKRIGAFKNVQVLTSRPRAKRGDEAQLRVDLKKNGGGRGEACGNSYIPKGHKCHKGKSPAKAEEKSESTKKGIPFKTFAKVALAAGATTAAVMVINDGRVLANKMDLPQTPTPKQAYRPFKQKGGKLSDAINAYYDAKVEEEGWKVGELVYTRPGKQVSGHFEVYLGKEKGVHKFGGLGATVGSKTGEFHVGNAGGMVFARAPESYRPKTKSKLSEEEIINRAELLTQFDLKYDKLKDNCEAWARAVIGDTPRSKQAEKLSPIAKALSNLADERFRKKSKSEGYIVDESKEIESAKKVAKKLEELEGLGAFDEMISGIKKRRSTEREGEELLEQLMRGDAMEKVFISPEELLSDVRSAAERVMKVRNYLMLHVAVLNEAKTKKE